MTITFSHVSPFRVSGKLDLGLHVSKCRQYHWFFERFLRFSGF